MSDILPSTISSRPRTDPDIPLRKMSGSNGVPVPLTPLVGRDREIEQIATFLNVRRRRLLTLIGPGGIGKTRLAIEVATLTAPTFAHGVRFVTLDSIRDPQLVGGTVAQALGIDLTDEAAAQDALLAKLEGRHVLLVLDTAEHVMSGVASWLVHVFAECSLLQVMVTSRLAVQIDGEQRFIVPPLPLPTCRTPGGPTDNPGVMLFAQRARAVNPDFVMTDLQANVIAHICRHLDGIPLAIELAASKIAVHTPSTILSRLTRSLSLLTGNRRDVPDRHQTMRDAIAWSYDLLLPIEQALFRVLGVFAGSFTLDAVEAVGGSMASEVLAVLIDHSLVRNLSPQGGSLRLGMYETIREFALEQLIAHGEEMDTRDTHAAYYLRRALEADQGEASHSLLRWFACLEDDQDNLRCAVVWLAHRGQIEEALKLATGALWYQRIRTLYAESRDLLDSAMPHGQVNIRTEDHAEGYDGLETLTPLLGGLYRVQGGNPETHSIGADLLSLTDLAFVNAAIGAGRGNNPENAGHQALDHSLSPISMDGTDPPGIPDSSIPLTSRELDVLRLIADGLTNQEIADMLSISLRTVTSHVTHVLTKLALTSRTAAVSYAIRHGLI